MRISRDKTIDRVLRAIAETHPELKSAAWDTAWNAIQSLRARDIGDDAIIAAKLTTMMRETNRKD